MAPGPQKIVTPEEELVSVINDFDRLAEEVDRAILRLAEEPGNEEAIDRLGKAKAAALRGAELVRGKLIST